MPTKRERTDQPAAKATAPTPVRRLRRAERREQLLAAATQAFARAGFANTSLDDIAEAGRASAGSCCTGTSTPRPTCTAPCWTARLRRLTAAVGTRDFTYASIDALLSAAAEDPDGFRLLFHHAAREPEFRQEMDRFHKGMVATARRELAKLIPDRAWVAVGRPAGPGGRHRSSHGLAGRRPTRPRPGRRPHPPGPRRRHQRRPVTQPPPDAQGCPGVGWLRVAWRDVHTPGR